MSVRFGRAKAKFIAVELNTRSHQVLFDDSNDWDIIETMIVIMEDRILAMNAILSFQNSADNKRQSRKYVYLLNKHDVIEKKSHHHRP